MLVNQCNIFPRIGRRLRSVRNDAGAQVLGDGVTSESVYSMIRLYNLDAKRRGDMTAVINDNNQYTDEQVREMASKIAEFVNSRPNMSDIIKDTKTAMMKAFSSKESQNQTATAMRVTGKELAELKSDVTNLFIGVVNVESKRLGMSVNDYVNSLTTDKLAAIFDTVMKNMLKLASKNKTDAIGRNDTDSARKIDSLAARVFGINMSGHYYDSIFYEIASMAIPLINTVYNIRINSDLSISQKTASTNDTESNLEDMELPQAEGWQVDPDEINPMSGMASSVNRLLMLSPSYEVAEHTEYIAVKDIALSNGKFIKRGASITEDEFLNIVDNDLLANKDDKRNLSPFSTFTEDKKKTTLTGLPMLSNPQYVGRKIFSITKDCSSGSEMISALERSGSRYKIIAEALRRSPMTRNTFISNFNRYHQQVVGTVKEYQEDGTYNYSTPMLNRSKTKDSFEAFKSGLFYGRNTSTSVFKVSSDGDNGNVVTIYCNRVDAYRKLINKVGGIYGCIDFYIKNGKYPIAGDLLSGFAVDNPAITNDNAMLGCITNMFNWIGIKIDADTALAIMGNRQDLQAMAKAFKGLFSKYGFSVNTNSFKDFSNSDSIKSNYAILLRMADRNGVETSYENMFSFAGKRQTSRILPSSTTALFKRIHSLNGDNLRNFLDARYLENPVFANYVDGKLKIRNRILSDLYYLSGQSEFYASLRNRIDVIRNMGENDTEAEDTDRRQHILMDITTYLNNPVPENAGTPIMNTPMMLQNGEVVPRNHFVLIPSFITGDNNSARYYRLLHYEEEEILNGIYDLFVSDINMQKVIKQYQKSGIVVKANNKETLTKKGNEKRFGTVDFLNNISEKEKSKLVDANGNIIDQAAFINDILKPYLEKEFAAFRAFLENNGILDVNNDGEYINFKQYIGKAENPQERLDEILYDFWLNYKFGMMNVVNLTQVSPLFFAGVKDMQKRNKGVLTNGYQIIRDAVDLDGKPIFGNDFSQRVAYFNDILVGVNNSSRKVMRDVMYKRYSKTMSSEEARKSADSYMGQFDMNTLTDGEAYRSLDSYRRILMSIGEPFWDKSKELAYQEINRIVNTPSNFDSEGNLTTESLTRINSLMLVMQPIKPINDGIETFGKAKIKIPFQLKYAEVPIVPEMYPAGSKLREMGMWMKRNNVDLMASTKCVKKGCFLEYDLQYQMLDGSYVDKDLHFLPGMDANGNEISGDDKPTAAEQRRYISNGGEDMRVPYGDSVSFDTIMDAQKKRYDNENDRVYGGYIHTITLESMLIQSNVPDHTDGESIFGTQGRKIIDSAIRSDVIYRVGSKDISGDRLKIYFNLLNSAKFAKSFEGFISTLNNGNRLTRNLAFSLLNNDRTNPAMVNRIILDSNGKPIIPFSEIGCADDIESMLISMFKKGVIRQTVPGGSVVQASSLGVGDKWVASQELNAIIEDGKLCGYECEMPFDFSYKDRSGKIVKLDYDKYCYPDGTFKPVSAESRLFTNNTLIERDFPGILDLVAYRIPTEKEYSMMRLHIKRVTPKGCANSIKLPAECTTIAGFDFDIDKLYLMRHNYHEEESKVDPYDVWTHFYTSSAFGENAAKQLKAKADSMTESEKDELRASLGKQPGERLFLHDYWNETNLASLEKSKSQIYDETLKEMGLDKPEMVSPKEDFSYGFDNVLDMSVDDINNALVDIYISVLTNESTASDRIAIGGFKNASDSARLARVSTHAKEMYDKGLITKDEYDGIKGSNGYEYLKKLLKEKKSLDYNEDYDYSEPETSIIFKEMNQAAGNLIGIFANDNVNAFISSKLKTLRFDDKSGILFGSLADPYSVRELNGVTSNIDASGIGYNLLNTSVNSIDTLKALSEMLAASVDAVKDPVLNYLNLNTITADAAGMLLRLGYTTDDIALLFNQPVIRKTCEYMRYNGINNVSTALKAVLRRDYNVADAGKLLNSTYSPMALGQNSLMNGIVDPESASSRNMQTEVAILFNAIIQNSKELSGFIQSTRNTSANVVKSRFADEISSIQKSGRDLKHLQIEAYDGLENPITNDWDDKDNPWNKDGNKEAIHKSLVDFLRKYSEHPFEYENMVYNITRYAMDYMMRKFTPYMSEFYSERLEYAAEMMAPWGLSGDVINMMLRDMPSIRLVNSIGRFNPLMKSSDGTTNAKRYIVGFITDFIGLFSGLNVNQSWLNGDTLESFMIYIASNDFMQSLDFVKFDKNDPLGRDMMDLRYPYSMSPEEKIGLANSFSDLYDRYPEFAKDIFMHFYYTKGLNPNVNRLLEIVNPDMLYIRADGNYSYVDLFDGDSPINESDGNKVKDVYRFMMMHCGDSNIVSKVPFHIADVTRLSDSSDDIISVSGEQLDFCRLQKDKETMTLRPLINIDGKIYALADAASVNTGTIRRFGDGLDINNVSADSNDAVYVIVRNEISEDIKSLTNDNNAYMFDRFDIKEERIVRGDTITADDKVVDNTVDAANNAAAQTKNNSLVDEKNQKVCGS